MRINVHSARTNAYTHAQHDDSIACVSQRLDPTTTTKCSLRLYEMVAAAATVAAAMAMVVMVMEVVRRASVFVFASKGGTNERANRTNKPNDDDDDVCKVYA